MLLLYLTWLLEVAVVAVVAVDPSDKWPNFKVVVSCSLLMQPLITRLQRFIISRCTASSQVRRLAILVGHSNQMWP